MSNKYIILSYDEYLELSGWAQKYKEIQEYARLPLDLLKHDLITKENSEQHLKGILRKLGE